VSDRPIDLALAESAQEVLEKMFFLDLSPAGPELAASQTISAEVIFDGDPPGSFRLAMDRNSARSAAADFLGLDPSELNTVQQNEVLCELANMICGSVLSRIESNATFRLGKPEIVREQNSPRWPASAFFEAAVGGGVLRAELVMERLVCPGSGERAS
jgi:CheY-specific phosphatase CheX